MERLFLFVILVSIGLLYARGLGLFGRRTESRPEIQWDLDLKAKIAWQRPNLIALFLLVIFGTLSGALPRGAAIASLIAGALALALRLRFGLTEDGVVINNRLLRLWTDFNHYQLRDRRLLLKGGRLNFFIAYLPKDKGRQKSIRKFVGKHLVQRG